MISASIAGTHRFGRVKKRGYDPAEVDAVVERLLDALAEYEDRTRGLEQKLEDSEVSASAVARTLAAVERTSVEILAEARAEATAIVERSTAEAEEIATLASALGSEVSATRDAILTEAYNEADELVIRSQQEAATKEITAAAVSVKVIDDAVRAADKLDHDAALRSRAASMVTAWRLRESQIAADRQIAEAMAKAALIVESAEYESERLGERVSELRSAVSNLQASAAELARATIADADVIDLEAIEARSHAFDHIPVKLAPVPTDIARTQSSEPGPETYYQRRTGGIKERIKIARSTT